MRVQFSPIRVAGLVSILLGLHGCIVVPVPQLPSDHDTAIEQDRIELIETGKTSRADIRKELGEPRYSFGDGSRWLYEANSHRAGGVRWCGGAAIPLGDGDGDLDDDDFVGGGGCTAKRDDRVVTYLDLRFGEADVVESVSLKKLASGRCEHGDICLDRHSRVMAVATADEDARAKSSDADNGHCALFVYSTTDAYALYFRIGDDGLVHRLVTTSGFLRFDLAEGPQRLDAAVVNRVEHNSGSIDIDCTSGSRHYVRQQHKRRSGVSFNKVSSIEGEKDIARRKLLSLRDPGKYL